MIDQLVERLGLPLMVKPAAGGSALGATIVRDAGDLPGALVASFGYADTALIERFVVGTEITVAVIDTGDGPQALPAVEIDALGGPYDYAARYTAGATEFYVPARVSDAGGGRRRPGSPSSPTRCSGWPTSAVPTASSTRTAASTSSRSTSRLA